MFLRTTIICIVLQTAASADTISSLTLDWNNDGFEDVARLDHSRSVAGRADLLLFEGSTAGPGSELVEVAPDFARAPSHPNMDLHVVQGSDANQIEVIETGKIAGPDLWLAKTSIRFDGQTFVVDRHETEQEFLATWEGGSSGCVVDFMEKIAGGGDDIMADLAPLDADPMPLVRWSASAFLQIMQNVASGECLLFEETYQSVKDTGTPIDHDLIQDWNNDGHMDHVILLDRYPHHSMAIFMGDETGNARLTWIVESISPMRGARLELRVPPGRRGAIEATVFGDTGEAWRTDLMTTLVWQDEAPIVAGFSVWQSFDDIPSNIDCIWDFARGKQINTYTDTWFDDPGYPEPYQLSAWSNAVMEDIIAECRP